MRKSMRCWWIFSSKRVLDLDNTDIPLYGEQEGWFFHGYYKEYCYLPLYVFCGRAICWSPSCGVRTWTRACWRRSRGEDHPAVLIGRDPQKDRLQSRPAPMKPSSFNDR